MRFCDPWGLAVTAWDMKYCNDDEIAQIAQATTLWSEGYSEGNQSKMDRAHAMADAARARARALQGATGNLDGTTNVPTSTTVPKPAPQSNNGTGFEVDRQREQASDGNTPNNNTGGYVYIPFAPIQPPPSKPIVGVGTVTTTENSTVTDLIIVKVEKTDSEHKVNSPSAPIYVNGGTLNQNGIKSYQGQVGINIGGLYLEVGGNVGYGVGVSIGFGWKDKGLTISGNIDTDIWIGVSYDHLIAQEGNVQTINSTGFSIGVDPKLIVVATVTIYTGVPVYGY